jgi:anaerobic selenocysteine-containing dehydrogenase
LQVKGQEEDIQEKGAEIEKLKAHVQPYSPERVAEITWIPADLIVKATRLYATNRPSYIEVG